MRSSRALPGGRSGSRLVAGGLLAALLVAASSLPTADGTTVRPPFPGAVHWDVTNRVVAGCGHIRGGGLYYNNRNGTGHTLVVGLVHDCSPSRGVAGANSTASYSGYLYLDLPISPMPGVATRTSVTVAWSFATHLNGSLIKPGACPPTSLNPLSGNGSSVCLLAASASINAGAYVVDLTNGSVYYPSNGWAGLWSEMYQYNYTLCALFLCSSLNYSYANSSLGSSPTAPTFFINGSFDHSHRYEIVTYVYCAALSEIFGFGRGQARTEIDLANPHHDFALSSISVS
jgi:hypothetical protein